MKLNGGCLCGDIRYEIDAKPIDSGFCHCSICQHAHAAPAVPWLTLPFSGFSYICGQVSTYASSDAFQREFCPRCGTQLAFRAINTPQTIDITLCSLDDNSQVLPQYHIWCKSKAPWLHITDELPQFEDAGPDNR